MSAEAEATDILVRVSMEGIEHFVKIAGAAAEQGLAFLFAAIKALYEKSQGKQKLGGKINTREFLQNFTASSVFSLTQEEFKSLKPELKRLHIPYMKYKPNKEMKNNSKIEISVRQEDAERFIRLAESKNIAGLTPYDFQCEEISENAYKEMLENGSAKGVDVSVSQDGTMKVNERENPTPASMEESLSNLSEQNSEISNSDNFTFDPKKGIDRNLIAAKVEAARRDGRLIPISANKDTLLIHQAEDSVILRIPGTKGQERIVVPKGDIVNMNADGGQTIRADLRRDYKYQILDTNNKPIRKSSGKEINLSRKWNGVRENFSPKPKTPRRGGR